MAHGGVVEVFGRQTAPVCALVVRHFSFALAFDLPRSCKNYALAQHVVISRRENSPVGSEREKLWKHTVVLWAAAGGSGNETAGNAGLSATPAL